jgi:hypothetical protein
VTVLVVDGYSTSLGAAMLAAIEKIGAQVVVLDEMPRPRHGWPEEHIRSMLQEVPMRRWWANPEYYFPCGDPWHGSGWDQVAVRLLRRHAPKPLPPRAATFRRPRPMTPRARNWSHLDYGRRLGRKR